MRWLIDWLEDHPKEIVVLWISGHGDGSYGCKGGEGRQYAGRDESTEAFWTWMVKHYGEKMINVKEMPPNTATLNQLWAAGKQILVYAAGYCELSGKGSSATTNPWTDGSHYALPDKGLCGSVCDDVRIHEGKNMQTKMSENNCSNTIANCGVGSGFVGKYDTLQGKQKELNAKESRAEFKKKNVFFLEQAVTSAWETYTGNAFELRRDAEYGSEHVDHNQNWFSKAGQKLKNALIRKEMQAMSLAMTHAVGSNYRDPQGQCRDHFGLPFAKELKCPRTLMDVVSLSNYWYPLSRCCLSCFASPSCVLV